MTEMADDELKKEFEDLIRNLGKNITDDSILPTIKTEFKDIMGSHIDTITTLNNLNMVFVKNLNDYVKEEGIIEKNNELTKHYGEFKDLIKDFNSFYGNNLKDSYDNLYRLDKYFERIEKDMPDINKLNEDSLKAIKRLESTMLIEITLINSKMDLDQKAREYMYEQFTGLERLVKEKVGQVSEDMEESSNRQRVDYQNLNAGLKSIEEENKNIEKTLFNYENRSNKRLNLIIAINMIAIISLFYILIKLL